MGLGTVAIGAFEENQLKEILKINEQVVYIMPVGKK
ncbi:MAG TPA: nitroreductase family protein [bacterium]|nr:nitroreductase family protein [bacterium]